MDLLRLILSIFNIFITSLTLMLTIIFLMAISIVYYNKRLNFFTILSCNTCIITFVFANNALAMIVYMILWDQVAAKRKRIFFVLSEGIYHSYVLQALYRYWHIKHITRFDSTGFRILLIVIQWTITIILPLPILFHGDLSQVSIGFSCTLSLFSVWVIVYVATTIYISSLGIISFLYYQVIVHIRKSTAMTTAAQQLSINRDVVVIRRTVKMIITLIICSLPFIIFFFIGLIHPSSAPDYYLHLTYLTAFSSILAQTIILISYTPLVKNCLIEMKNRYFENNNRVIPVDRIQQNPKNQNE